MNYVHHCPNSESNNKTKSQRPFSIIACSSKLIKRHLSLLSKEMSDLIITFELYLMRFPLLWQQWEWAHASAHSTENPPSAKEVMPHASKHHTAQLPPNQDASMPSFLYSWNSSKLCKNLYTLAAKPSASRPLISRPGTAPVRGKGGNHPSLNLIFFTTYGYFLENKIRRILCVEFEISRYLILVQNIVGLLHVDIRVRMCRCTRVAWFDMESWFSPHHASARVHFS